MRTRTVRHVVVGSGCAGWNAADWLLMLGETDTVLVTEDRLAGTSRNTGSDKQTYYKLSLAGDDGDSPGALAHMLAKPDVNGDTALCEAAGSASCFFRLAGLGVPFPMNEYGEYVGYQTDHDTRKRATSAGPLTSRFMTEALERSAMSHGLEVLDHTLAVKIGTDANGVTGLLCLDTVAHDWLWLQCADILLCTGGPAHIYSSRVYPESQHGMSGLAFEAGAAGANLDCWQYGLASVDFRWNLSGSYQQALPRYVSVEADGTEHEFLAEALGEEEALRLAFLKGYQWPFDPAKVKGSSRVDILVKEQEDLGRWVYMDYRRNPSGYAMEHLSEEAREYLVNCGADKAMPIDRLAAINAPAIALYRSHGIDLAAEMLRVSVCAQHHNGGIAVDSDWQTEVPGLYVCGEAAGTFGKVRPGGTALNSTQVGSMRAARHAAKAQRPLRESAAPEITVPTGDAAVLQREMTRVAAFQRDEHGMEALLQKVSEALTHMSPAEGNEPDLKERLLLRDILLTQREVLSAMLFDLRCGGTEGVLRTGDGHSERVPARPFPERDLWFERVWKKYREEA